MCNELSRQRQAVASFVPGGISILLDRFSELFGRIKLARYIRLLCEILNRNCLFFQERVSLWQKKDEDVPSVVSPTPTTRRKNMVGVSKHS